MSGDIAAMLEELVTRQRIEDTLYRYGSAIDTQDFETLRSILHPGVEGFYGDSAHLVGRDELVAWIEDKTRDRGWQHHLLSVYHVDVHGDEATALTYHTSHSTSRDDPSTVTVVVARYRDTLERSASGTWLIRRKEMDVGWREQRDASGDTP